jgi:hypothetical protein
MTRETLRQTKNSFLKEVFNGPVTGIESLVEKFFKNRGIMLTKDGRKAPAFRHGDIRPCPSARKIS